MFQSQHKCLVFIKHPIHLLPETLEKHPESNVTKHSNIWIKYGL